MAEAELQGFRQDAMHIGIGHAESAETEGGDICAVCADVEHENSFGKRSPAETRRKVGRARNEALFTWAV
ncbi:hypothetical protein GCM10010924_29190 [Rhizobium wenxiniae]|nr:hypothetical protein GCM10010924_29190 [Rhizobium wenxiniae]